MTEESSGGVGIRQTFRRGAALLRAVRGNLRFLLLLIGTPVFVVLIYSIPLDQSHVVEARTLGARITILGPDTVWRLPESTLCADRKESRDLKLATTYAGSGCNPGIFTETALAKIEVRIPSGVEILVRSEPDGGVLLRRLADPSAETEAPVRLSGDTFWQSGSVLRIAPEPWRSVALLEFAGNVVIGQEASNGSTDYLIEGRYEVRERFLRQYRPLGWSQAEPTTVKSNTLYRGDKVSFAPSSNGTSSPGVFVTGFISPHLTRKPSGFNVVTSSSFDQSQANLVVKSFGSRERAIAPSWVDRAVRDPMLVALTAILGFAVTTLTFAAEVRKFGQRKETEQK